MFHGLKDATQAYLSWVHFGEKKMNPNVSDCSYETFLIALTYFILVLFAIGTGCMLQNFPCFVFVEMRLREIVKITEDEEARDDSFPAASFPDFHSGGPIPSSDSLESFYREFFTYSRMERKQVVWLVKYLQRGVYFSSIPEKLEKYEPFSESFMLLP